MRIFILVMIVASLIPLSVLSQNLSDLQWLSGNWVATKNRPGKLRTERWESPTGSRMNGYGTVKQGGDTTFLEKMRIEKKDGLLYFVADVPENKEPVFFRITTVSPSGFESENPEHDFPKKIVYSVKNDSLTVTISGNGKSAGFYFIRN